MAKTNVSTSDALRKTLEEEKLFRDIIKESFFFPKFASEFANDNLSSSASNVLQVKTDLEGMQGDKMTFGLRTRLAGSGVTGDQTLEGNEEALSTNSDSIELEMYRHAVRDDGGMTRKRAAWDVVAESRAAIRDWGTEKIDELIFTAAFDSPNQILAPDSTFKYSSIATAKAALTTADKLSPAFLNKAKAAIKTGFNRDQTPLRPVKVEGKDYFVLVVHPDSLHDLKRDAEWNEAVRMAEVRGGSNPIFSGATAIWDGIIIFDHENCLITLDGGGSTDPIARGLLMGAQALQWGWGVRPSMVERDFDYGNQKGFGWEMIGKANRPVFNSKDYGCINIITSRTQISDAT
jgi:N4-gp56 family major capsid protein